MLPAELAAIDNHEHAKTLCNQLIAQCQTFNDISTLVNLTLIRERTPPGATLSDSIDNHPNAPTFRYAMSYYLFSEWQTATRIRLTRAVCRMISDA